MQAEGGLSYAFILHHQYIGAILAALKKSGFYFIFKGRKNLKVVKNMNKITKTILVEASILGVFILVLGLVYFKGAEGTAPQGMKATTASSTVRSLQVGPQQLKTIFSNGDCVSRIITTYSQPIFLYFASSSETGGHSNPGEQFGHIQGASSTVAYDSGLYGCSDVRVYAVASTTPTLTEFKGFR